MDDGRITIHSYRVCFALDRRIHKIDRWRIPVPYGVPLRGVGYAAAVLVALLALASVPLLGAAVGALHPALRFVAIPVAAAFVLCRWEIDGRPAHDGLASWLRLLLGPRRLVGARAASRAQPPVAFGSVAVAADESQPRLRRGVVRGPATVLLRYPFESRAGGSELRVSQRPGGPRWRGKQVKLGAGQRLVVR